MKNAVKTTKEYLQLSLLAATIVIGVLNIWLANKLIPIEKSFSALASDVSVNSTIIIEMKDDISDTREDVGIIRGDIKHILEKL